jgi:hypothetical protein
MKNVIIIGSILVFTATTAFAQDEMAFNEPVKLIAHKTTKEQREENRLIRREKAAITPNYMTKQNFMFDFPNAANVSWKRGEFEEASFTWNGKDMKAFMIILTILLAPLQRPAIQIYLPGPKKKLKNIIKATHRNRFSCSMITSLTILI